MMREEIFGCCRLLADAEATRAYYGAHPLPWLGCGCDGCRNFERAVKLLPPAVRALFSRLGLDPEKPGEIYVLYQTEDGQCLYGGFYHLRGRLLAGESPWPVVEQRPQGRTARLEEERMEEIGGLSFGFSEDCSLLPEDFPRPCLQMEVLLRLPWVLEEPNPYEKG